MPINNKILVLKQEYPVKREFRISGNAQIGRSPDMEWCNTSRARPEESDGLEVVIQVVGERSLSRNHLGILKKPDGYYAVDLNSGNSTLIKEKEGYRDMNPSRKYSDIIQLVPGDCIRMGRLEFTVGDWAYERFNNYALLVGHDGGNLRGVKNDLELLAEELDRRCFDSITRLHNGKATKDGIMRSLDEIARLATRNSKLLFHYSGHGCRKGIALGAGWFGHEYVSPEELYSGLRKIRGKKAVLLDCCNAGVFINDVNRPKIPKNTLVITASSEELRAYEKQTMLAGGSYMGRFTAALIRYLENNQGRLDLKGFREVLEKPDHEDIPLMHQQPCVHCGDNDTFTLTSIV